MANKLILFGTAELAEVACFYLSRDSDFDICAFTVDGDFVSEDRFLNRPVIPFEAIQDHFDPADAALFVAIGYGDMNKTREKICQGVREKGYRLASYVSSKALVAHPDRIGANCFILEHNTVQPFGSIGDNVFIWSGNHIGHHVHIGDNVFIASHVVISGGVTIGRNSFIGVNATVADHVEVGEYNFLGPNSLITASTDNNAVYREKSTEKSPVPAHRLRW